MKKRKLLKLADFLEKTVSELYEVRYEDAFDMNAYYSKEDGIIKMDAIGFAIEYELFEEELVWDRLDVYRTPYFKEYTGMIAIMKFFDLKIEEVKKLFFRNFNDTPISLANRIRKFVGEEGLKIS